jgi:glucosamine-6-phosphate deaminase
MKVRILRTAADAAMSTASTAATHLERKAASVLGLPTGRTFRAVYKELVRLHAAGQADFSRAHTFNIDEFVGLHAMDRGSFAAFMQTHLFRYINIPADRVHFLDGRAPDVGAECSRFEREIAGVGGLDLLLLGLGINGHIGFNEPAASLQARTHRARLTPETRRANAAGFGGRMAAVPREALTMGMATLLEARSIVLLATGRDKAGAVRSMLNGDVTTALPASFLQLHGRVEVILDRAAARKLPAGIDR